MSNELGMSPGVTRLTTEENTLLLSTVGTDNTLVFVESQAAVR